MVWSFLGEDEKADSVMKTAGLANARPVFSMSNCNLVCKQLDFFGMFTLLSPQDLAIYVSSLPSCSPSLRYKVYRISDR
ncbi:hypothetical protein AYJ58_15475 [Shewanella sp. Pdp11]|nr:hypothetical protein AYJ58_15475 [Shewanella sp. Pdp11]